jgi:hypothetical protein
MSSSGMLRPVALIKADVSEERISSIIRVTKIRELGTTLAVRRNRSTQLADSLHSVDGAILLPKRRLLQVAHSVTSQKTAFFEVLSCSFNCEVLYVILN